MIIYKITNLVNGKAYIGQSRSKRGAKRWYRHRWDATSEKGRPFAIHRAIRKYGVASFRFDILCECSSQSEMDACERRLITEHGTLRPNGYNLMTGGEGGGERCLETRKRISAANKGRHIPQEQRDRTSKTLKANPIVVAQARSLAALNHKRNKGRVKMAAEVAKIVASRRANPSATRKLTVGDVAEIRSALIVGKRAVDLARQFRVTKSAITAIKRAKTWRDVSPAQSHILAAVPNPNIKLTATMVSEIRASLLSGGAGPNLAFRYGVTVNTISAIRTGASWAHVAPEALAELRRRGDPQLRLSADNVAEIKIALMLGERVPDLGRQYRVDPETIRDIKAGRSWRAVMPAGLSDFVFPMGS